MAVVHRYRISDLTLDDGDTIAVVGDGVGTTDLEQATEANKQIFKENALGDFPSAVNSATDFLRTADGINLSNFTFIFVAKSTDVSSVDKVFAQLAHFADNLIINRRSVDQWSYFNGTSHNTIGNANTGEWQVLGCKGSNMASFLTIGGSNVGAENFIGEWIEIEIHDEQLSDGALAAAITSKETFYGIEGDGSGTAEEIIFWDASQQEGQETPSPGVQTGDAFNAIANFVAGEFNDLEADSTGSFKATGNGTVANSNQWLTPEKPTRNCRNHAVGGRLTTASIVLFNTEVADIPSGSKKLVATLAANDLGGGASAATGISLYDQVSDLCDGAATVFFPTTMPKIAVGINNESTVNAYNAKVDTVNASLITTYAADRLIRYDRNTETENPATAMVSGDGVHFNEAAKAQAAKDTFDMLRGAYVRPLITSNSLAAATNGTAFTRQLTATNTISTWQIKSGGTTGLSINSSGLISGTNAVAVGTYNLVIRAINTTTKRFDEKTLTLTVNAPGGADTTDPYFIDIEAVAVSQTQINIIYDVDDADGAVVGVDIEFSATGASLQAASGTNGWTNLLNNVSPNSPYEHLNRTPGTRYYHRARVRDDSGNVSDWEGVDTYTFNLARFYCAIPDEDEGVTGHRWQVNTSNSFTTNSPTPVLTDYTQDDIPEYIKTNAVIGQTYYFRVEARDAAGNWSGYSTVSSLLND